MALYDNPIDILNAALLRLGEEPTQEGAASAAARVFRGVFDGLARSMMARHKFGFARKQAQLTYKGLDERDGYHLHQMPNDVLLVHSIVGTVGQARNYEVRGDVLVSPYDENVEIHVLYTYAAPVAEWSPDFAEAVITRCESILNKALLEDVAAAERDRERSDMLLLEAITRDKFQNPPERWIVPELPHVYRRASRYSRRAPVINTITSVR